MKVDEALKASDNGRIWLAGREAKIITVRHYGPLPPPTLSKPFQGLSTKVINTLEWVGVDPPMSLADILSDQWEVSKESRWRLYLDNKGVVDMDGNLKDLSPVGIEAANTSFKANKAEALKEAKRRIKKIRCYLTSIDAATMQVFDIGSFMPDGGANE